MNRASICSALLLALLAAPLPGRAEPVLASYLPGTEDVPLMPGLAADDAAGVVFDKPEGRIVAVEAAGPVSRRAVLDFYRASLPELGWQPTGPHRFERAGERLSLDFGGSDGNLRVGFTLAPQ